MRSCDRCEKTKQMAFTRSHSNQATKRAQRPNLQKATIDGKKMLLCASCIQALARKKA